VVLSPSRSKRTLISGKKNHFGSDSMPFVLSGDSDESADLNGQVLIAQTPEKPPLAWLPGSRAEPP